MNYLFFSHDLMRVPLFFPVDGPPQEPAPRVPHIPTRPLPIPPDDNEHRPALPPPRSDRKPQVSTHTEPPPYPNNSHTL